jgi:hypothetical protein
VDEITVLYLDSHVLDKIVSDLLAIRSQVSHQEHTVKSPSSLCRLSRSRLLLPPLRPPRQTNKTRCCNDCRTSLCGGEGQRVQIANVFCAGCCMTGKVCL